jgi:hypothetical protein
MVSNSSWLNILASKYPLRSNFRSLQFVARSHLGFDRDLCVVSHAQDMEVLEAVLEHVDQLIVAVRVGRHHEEAMFQYEVAAITDNALDDLVVLKTNAHPQAGDDGGMLVKVQCTMLQIAIEGLDEEDCLRVLRRHVRDLFGVDELQPDGIQRLLRVTSQQLINRSQIFCLSEAPYSMILIADDQPIGLFRLRAFAVRPYARS